MDATNSNSVHSVENSEMDIDELVLAPATLDELPIALDMLDASAQWLIGKGIQQWQTPLPADFTTFMRDEACAGGVYLARTGKGGSPIATFRITHYDIPRWHDSGEDNALYVYSFAIRNDMHGLGIGAQVLNEITRMAGEQEKDWLRLDCWTQNHKLQGYYKSLGFSQAGEIDDDGFPLALFQVRISSGKRQLL